jgi:hypothetical protein
MGTFAETAIVFYRLVSSDQGKQMSVFHFCLQQTNGCLPFLFSICKKPNGSCHLLLVPTSLWGILETWRHGDMEIETGKHGDMETWRHGHGDIKWKTGTSSFCLIGLTFAHCTNKSLLSVHLLTKK